MKVCPKCKREYSDDNLRFCLDDGVLLETRTAVASDVQPTLRIQPQTVPRPKPPTTVPSVEPKPAVRRQLWPMVIGFSALALAVLLIGGWWISTHSDSELLYQTRNDHTVKMRLLLMLGANVNAKDETDSTPLMGAAWRGQSDAAKMLLEHSANLNARNKSGETPLILAAKEGRSEIVRLLLDRNPDLNAKDNDGWTCLMWAAWNGHTDTVKLLLNTGVRVTAKNNLGETAEFLATKKLHYDIATLLRAAD
ncbi:MAG: ankyrin repeat domain-containing protein [Acidobacteriota bacterium]